jgi:hypothetical protein
MVNETNASGDKTNAVLLQVTKNAELFLCVDAPRQILIAVSPRCKWRPVQAGYTS